MEVSSCQSKNDDDNNDNDRLMNINDDNLSINRQQRTGTTMLDVDDPIEVWQKPTMDQLLGTAEGGTDMDGCQDCYLLSTGIPLP
jgi:hypothetical protein